MPLPAVAWIVPALTTLPPMLLRKLELVAKSWIP